MGAGIVLHGNLKTKTSVEDCIFQVESCPVLIETIRLDSALCLGGLRR